MVHSATKYLGGHSDLLMGAVVAADDALCDVLKGRRDLLGAIPGTLEAWLALRGLRTLHVRLERAQANAAELARRLADHPAVARGPLPGLRRDGRRSSSPAGADAAADLCAASTHLWVHTTSLGGVESTLERRRRWAPEPATDPGRPAAPLGRHRGRRGPLGRPGAALSATSDRARLVPDRQGRTLTRRLWRLTVQ